MSAIINQSLFYRQNHPQVHSHFFQSKSSSQQYIMESQCNNFLRMLKLSPLRHYQIHNIRKISSGQLEAILYVTYRQRFGIKSKIYINFQTYYLSINFGFLERENLIHLSNKIHTNMIFPLLQKINIFNTSQNLTFILNPANGILQSKTCNPFLNGHQGSVILNKYVIFFIQSIQRLMMDQVNCIMDMLDYKFTQEKTEENNNFLDIMMAKSNIMMQIKDLISLSHIKLHQFPTTEQQKCLRKKLVKQFMTNKSNILISCDKQNIISKQSYLYSPRLDEIYYLSNKLTGEIVQNQLAKSYQHLFNKFETCHLAEGQNAYVYNSVTIKDQKNSKIINSHYEGGFSRLQLAQLDMANSEQVDPVFLNNDKDVKVAKLKQQNRTINKKKQIYLQKMVAIKISKDKADYQKIKHEKIIVQNFKNTISPYFIKYYNATQPNFNYRHYLLMDYFGDLPNLSSYYQQNQESITLSSKLKIFLHLARSLTILQSKSIAHMDFTPHNIFIAKDVIPKIIDFGQAYHPCIQTNKITSYLPGYTLPYCPPETFNKKKIFQPRSDTFSFGVIMFKLLFNRFPYNITKQLQKSYMNDKYMQKFFTSPQGLFDIYNSKISSLFLQLIMHCMQENSTSRPYPFWIYVILVKIFQLLG